LGFAQAGMGFEKFRQRPVYRPGGDRGCQAENAELPDSLPGPRAAHPSRVSHAASHPKLHCNAQN